MRGTRVEAASSGPIALDTLLAEGVRENPDVDMLATRDERGISILVWNYYDDDVAGADSPIKLSVQGLARQRTARLDEALPNRCEP